MAFPKITRWRLVCALALAGASTATLAAQPREILILRHAEKPDDGNDANLIPRGYARAAALVQFFAASFDTPDYLFAAQASKQSNRPVETLTPLATALHIKLNSAIADADYATLAQQILSDPQYAGKLLIVCWHHGNIPGLAKALGADDAPHSWPDAVFDRSGAFSMRMAAPLSTICRSISSSAMHPNSGILTK